jgi:hypothetical protein
VDQMNVLVPAAAVGGRAVTLTLNIGNGSAVGECVSQVVCVASPAAASLKIEPQFACSGAVLQQRGTWATAWWTSPIMFLSEWRLRKVRRRGRA